MKTAVITGTSSGLGEGFARALLDLGWKVYGISRRDAPAELATHTNFRQICMDLEKPLDKKLLGEQIQEKRIELLVNNAGTFTSGLTNNWNQNEYERLFQLHYVNPAQLIAYFSSKLKDGMLISILSDNSMVGWPKMSLYSSSKAALLLHTKTFAAEFPDVTVYNFLPCEVDTPFSTLVGEEAIANGQNFIKVNDIVTVFLQAISGALAIPTGSSIVLYNNWEDGVKQELRKDEYLYNVDSESLTKL